MANLFPDIVYRRGTTEDVRGVLCDTLRVDDQEALDVALDAGWLRLPPTNELEPAEPATPTLAALDTSAAALIAAIPEMTPEELAAMLEAEKAGKARKGLIAALEKALAPPSAET